MGNTLAAIKDDLERNKSKLAAFGIVITHFPNKIYSQAESFDMLYGIDEKSDGVIGFEFRPKFLILQLPGDPGIPIILSRVRKLIGYALPSEDLFVRLMGFDHHAASACIDSRVSMATRALASLGHFADAIINDIGGYCKIWVDDVFGYYYDDEDGDGDYAPELVLKALERNGLRLENSDDYEVTVKEVSSGRRYEGGAIRLYPRLKGGPSKGGAAG